RGAVAGLPRLVFVFWGSPAPLGQVVCDVRRPSDGPGTRRLAGNVSTGKQLPPRADRGVRAVLPLPQVLKAEAASSVCAVSTSHIPLVTPPVVVSPGIAGALR